MTKIQDDRQMQLAIEEIHRLSGMIIDYTNKAMDTDNIETIGRYAAVNMRANQIRIHTEILKRRKK